MSLDPERPILRCFVGFFDPLAGGLLTDPRLVPIEDVPAYLRVGYWCVGPDPADQLALADWERSHQPNPWIWQNPV